VSPIKPIAGEGEGRGITIGVQKPSYLSRGVNKISRKKKKKGEKRKHSKKTKSGARKKE